MMSFTFNHQTKRFMAERRKQKDSGVEALGDDIFAIWHFGISAAFALFCFILLSDTAYVYDLLN